jgi:septal ring factor EnvC (AmiA/AmiB activator)
MRVLSFVFGGLLLVVGVSAVLIADRQRQEAVEQARSELERAEERLAEAQTANLELAEILTSLRSAIAEQEDELADTEGFLK